MKTMPGRHRTAAEMSQSLTDTLTAIDFVVKNFGNPGAGGLTPIGKLLENDLLAVKQEAAALEAKLIEFRTGSLPP